MDKFFDFELTGQLLNLDFVQKALLAAAILALVAGLIGPLIVMRRMAFAVHGTSELAFTGAAGALLLGLGIEAGALAGAVIAALLLGLLGGRESDRDSVIGVILSFGLGLGVLFLWFYPGRAANKFGLLIGQAVTVDSTNLSVFAWAAAGVVVVLAVIYRPLLFASVDLAVAKARGVPVATLTVVFTVLVGVTTALGVRTVGSLLVLALLVTPAAAASRVATSPLVVTALSVLFAEIAAVGGIVLSLAPGAPSSAFVTGFAFVIYLGCRLIAFLRDRTGNRAEKDTRPSPREHDTTLVG